MKKRLLIIEPSEIITLGLSSIIHEDSSYKILPSFDSFSNLEDKISCLKPDILIVNPTIFHVSQHEKALSAIQENSHIVTLALVYQYIENHTLRHYDAIIDIRESRSSILETLSQTVATKHELHSNSSQDLTDRERDILVLVAQGLMSKEIANQLNISIHTVISHRKNITRKTGIKSVAGLTIYAMLNNLLDSTDTKGFNPEECVRL